MTYPTAPAMPTPVPPPTVLLVEVAPIRLVHSFDPHHDLEKTLMATIAEFKATVLQKIADMQTASASEHTQVLAAIQALKDQVVNTVPDADVAEVTSAFDAATTGITNIFEPDAPAAAAARAARH